MDARCRPGRRRVLFALTAGCLLVALRGAAGESARPLEVKRAHWVRWAEARGLDPAAPTEAALRQLATGIALLERYAELPAATRHAIDATVREGWRAWAGQVVEQRLAERLDLSPAAIARAFAAEPERWQRQGMVRFSHLAIHAASDAQRASAQARAVELHRRLSAGEDFAELARRHSDADNAFRGGEVGWVRPERLAPPVAQALARLEPGEVSGPLETERGWVLLRLDDARSAQTATLAEASPRVKLRLRRQGLAAELARFDAEAAARWPATTLPGPLPAGAVAVVAGRELNDGDLERFVHRRHPAVDLDTVARSRLPELVAELVVHQRRGLHAEAAGWLVAADWQPRADALRASATLEALVERRVEEPGEEEVKAAFARRRETLAARAALELSTLRVDFDLGAGRDRLAVMEALAERLARGELSLADARRQLDPEQRFSRLEHHGWLDDTGRRLLGPYVGEAARTMAPGETRGPIVQDRFLFLVHCAAARGDGEVRYEDVRGQIRRRLRERRLVAARQAVTEELIQGREVVLVDRD